MLVLDKSIETNEIIVTISEHETVGTNNYWMGLHSSFTHKDYTINLGANQSQFKERYDSFLINKTMFESMEDGDYTYKIYSGETGDTLLESGYLKIISTDNEIVYLTMDEPEEEDDFIVYNQ